MDSLTILNYQGSKKNLIDFIHKNTCDYIIENKAILDIFSGTCSVGYSFKDKHKVFANDSENYAYVISKALLGSIDINHRDKIADEVYSLFHYNYENLEKSYQKYVSTEECCISSENIEKLTNLYVEFPTIWNTTIAMTSDLSVFNLFSTYYAGSYFGIKQSMEIDSLRFAIEKIDEVYSIKDVLLASLFFAMKECVFSKDGHMAQPLSISKNSKKLISIRTKSIYDSFSKKLKEFFSDSFTSTNYGNRSYNLDFTQLLKKTEISKNVGFIYADPPYTDMQYSRYYHLLNVVSKYEYPKPTIFHGKYTKGLYTEDRFQSRLSTKRNCLNDLSDLINYSKINNINLAISFAYPENIEIQKTDRYVMSIDEIVQSCCNVFDNSNVKVESVNYTHSNNRNSESKKVLEYLVLCKGVK